MSSTEFQERQARVLLDQPGLMRGLFLRVVYLASGVAGGLAAIGFTIAAPAVRELWPWPDGPLSHAFVGAVLAAFAAGSLFVGLTGRWRAAQPALAGLVVASAGSAVYLGMLHQSGEFGPLHWHAGAMAACAFLALLLLPLSRGGEASLAWMSTLARWSCVAFALALAVVAGALIAGQDNVFPWVLHSETSVLFGLIFVGLSVAYALTALRNERGSGIVTLLGFLVYDALLLPRFMPLLPSIPPERLPSLVAYCAVLGFSAVVAVDFLFFGGRRMIDADDGAGDAEP